MKKAIASGLIGLIALGGGAAIAAPAAFAQEIDDLNRYELRRAQMSERRAEKIDTLTSVLGLSAEDLLAAHDAGQSLADVAAAQGVDLQTVIDALVANSQVRIDAKLASGSIDANRAAEISANIEDRVTARANGQGPERTGEPAGA